MALISVPDDSMDYNSDDSDTGTVARGNEL